MPHGILAQISGFDMAMLWIIVALAARYFE